MKKLILLSVVLLAACGTSEVKTDSKLTATANITLDTLNLQNSHVVELTTEQQVVVNSVVHTIPDSTIKATRAKAQVILDSVLKVQADTLK